MSKYKLIVNRVVSSRYLKSILQLATGSFLAQVITIMASPISTRLFTAEQLGIYTMMLTFSSIFGPVILGRYDMAIVSAEDDNEIVDLIFGSLICMSIFASLISFAYYLYLKSNHIIYNEVGGGAYLIILSLIIQGFHNILINFNNRNKEYSLMSKVYVIRAFVQNSTMIILGFLQVGTIGLLISQFLGLIVGLKKQSKSIIDSGILTRKTSLNNIKKTLWKNRNQLLYSTPAHFTNSASYSILNLFISGLFGFSVFGYYSLSYRILGLPLNLISDNVSKVFYQKASEEKRETGNYVSSFRYMTVFLTSISIFMVTGFILLGPYLFELIFGDGWHISGKYVQILAPMFGIRFIVTALSPALIISNKQKLELILQSLFIILSLGNYFLSKLLVLDFQVFLMNISISYSIVYLLFLVIIYKISKENSGGKL